jgi:hypothetical protein
LGFIEQLECRVRKKVREASSVESEAHTNCRRVGELVPAGFIQAHQSVTSEPLDTSRKGRGRQLRICLQTGEAQRTAPQDGLKDDAQAAHSERADNDALLEGQQVTGKPTEESTGSMRDYQLVPRKCVEMMTHRPQRHT